MTGAMSTFRQQTTERLFGVDAGKVGGAGLGGLLVLASTFGLEEIGLLGGAALLGEELGAAEGQTDDELEQHKPLRLKRRIAAQTMTSINANHSTKPNNKTHNDTGRH